MFIIMINFVILENSKLMLKILIKVKIVNFKNKIENVLIIQHLIVVQQYQLTN